MFWESRVDDGRYIGVLREIEKEGQSNDNYLPQVASHRRTDGIPRILIGFEGKRFYICASFATI
jgi:hypothetical protein